MMKHVKQLLFTPILAMLTLALFLAIHPVPRDLDTNRGMLSPMGEALGLIIEFCFGQLGLHRRLGFLGRGLLSRL